MFVSDTWVRQILTKFVHLKWSLFVAPTCAVCKPTGLALCNDFKCTCQIAVITLLSGFTLSHLATSLTGFVLEKKFFNLPLHELNYPDGVQDLAFCVLYSLALHHVIASVNFLTQPCLRDQLPRPTFYSHVDTARDKIEGIVFFSTNGATCDIEWCGL